MKLCTHKKQWSRIWAHVRIFLNFGHLAKTQHPLNHKRSQKSKQREAKETEKKRGKKLCFTARSFSIPSLLVEKYPHFMFYQLLLSSFTYHTKWELACLLEMYVNCCQLLLALFLFFLYCPISKRNAVGRWNTYVLGEGGGQRNCLLLINNIN